MGGRRIFIKNQKSKKKEGERNSEAEEGNSRMCSAYHLWIDHQLKGVLAIKHKEDDVEGCSAKQKISLTDMDYSQAHVSNIKLSLRMKKKLLAHTLKFYVTHAMPSEKLSPPFCMLKLMEQGLDTFIMTTSTARTLGIIEPHRIGSRVVIRAVKNTVVTIVVVACHACGNGCGEYQLPENGILCFCRDARAALVINRVFGNLDDFVVNFYPVAVVVQGSLKLQARPRLFVFCSVVSETLRLAHTIFPGVPIERTHYCVQTLKNEVFQKVQKRVEDSAAHGKSLCDRLVEAGVSLPTSEAVIEKLTSMTELVNEPEMVSCGDSFAISCVVQILDHARTDALFMGMYNPTRDAHAELDTADSILTTMVKHADNTGAWFAAHCYNATGCTKYISAMMKSMGFSESASAVVVAHAEQVFCLCNSRIEENIVDVLHMYYGPDAATESSIPLTDEDGVSVASLMRYGLSMDSAKWCCGNYITSMCSIREFLVSHMHDRSTDISFTRK